jgi:uncharacterized membrane protein
MPYAAAILVWAGVIAGFGAATAALYGRYRLLPAALTGPVVCKLDDANGCQVLFRSRFAAVLGVPNALLGVVCYALIAIGISQGWPIGLLFAGASAALAMSIYLAHVLVRDRLQCRICWTGHFAAALLWLGLGLALMNTKGGQP